MKFFEHVRSAIVGAAIAALALMGSGPAFAQGFTLPDGSAVQGHLKAATQPGATPPTAVGCTIDPGSTDVVGKCTATAASGSITFSRTFTAAPVCLVVDASATSTVSMPVYTVSATAITLSTIISTHILFYWCVGNQGST
ncbi:MAG: hypothetical protein KGJ13_06670 [Patescibacteria group bacterium]|nr:hypothetical protein [Patescibacteria group bacterium]